MAEGWARWLGRLLVEVQSAGIGAHGKNPRAIAVMKEAGLDISGQEWTQVTDAMLEQAGLVVTACGHADEHCPILPAGTLKEHWPLEDPAKATGSEDEIMEIFRCTRDDIKHQGKEVHQQYVQSEQEKPCQLNVKW